jgi:hypothetical protein
MHIIKIEMCCFQTLRDLITKCIQAETDDYLLENKNEFFNLSICYASLYWDSFEQSGHFILEYGGHLMIQNIGHVPFKDVLISFVSLNLNNNFG